MNRTVERIFLLAITLVLGLFFYQLYQVFQAKFVDVNPRMQAGTMVNLNAKNPAVKLRNLLEKGYYFEDPNDIALVETTVQKAISSNPQLDNVGELNKRHFYLLADDAFEKGGKVFKSRVAASRALLGYTGADSLQFEKERKRPQTYPSTQNIGLGTHKMEGTILANENPQQGVLVRLEMILPQDSLYSDELVEDQKYSTVESHGITKIFVKDSDGKGKLQQLTAYARTDANGQFSFNELPAQKSFKVLPLRPGYQFGSSKGVQSLENDQSFTFTKILIPLSYFQHVTLISLRKKNR